MIAFAAVLGLAAVAAFLLTGQAPPRARAMLRFCCALYGVLAASLAFSIAPVTVAPLVTTLTVMLLVLSLCESLRRHPPPALTALLAAAACIVGLLAAASAEMAWALMPQLLCLVFAMALVRRAVLALRAAGIYLLLAALSLLAAASALLAGDLRVALPLFSSAGLLGFVLALSRGSETFVEAERTAKRQVKRTGAIGRTR
jgi:hypothetical protein